MAEDKSVQQMQATGARLLQSSPGLAERLASSGRMSIKTGGGGRDDRDSAIVELQRQLDSEKDKNRSLEDQYKYRIGSFVKRESQTKNKIESLERRLNTGTDADEHVQRMAVIENMHKSVVAGLECIQNNTAKILQDQEKDLMRAFRARLQEVSKDLETQRGKKGEHSTELQARHRRVVSELHEAQELAQTFDKKNQQLAAENQKLLEKLNTREDDRQALLKELVSARKEVARLKEKVKEGDAPEQVARAPEPPRKGITQKQVDQARLQQTSNRQYEREVAYRDAIQKLKRMLEAEKKTARTFKQHQADLMQQRTELEVLLQQCLDDVKAELLRHRAENEKQDKQHPLEPDQPISTVSIADLSVKDRERVLQLLLSQQRVVQLLYSKTFQQQMGSPPEEDLALTPKKEDDFAWLNDIMAGEA